MPYGNIDLGEQWLRHTEGTELLPEPMLTDH